MRILSLVCGLAVLFTTLAYAHIIHHVLTVHVRGEAPGTEYWLGVVGAGLVGILSFIGGCMLLRQARQEWPKLASDRTVFRL